MTTLQASAPGKIVLCGEYAVLHGAPAVVATVDRRAVVRIEATDGAGIMIEMPGFSDEPVRAQVEHGRLRIDDRSAELVRAVWNEVLPDVNGSLRITLDTRAFHDGPDKLGFGSSAAMAVALTAALLPGATRGGIAQHAGRAHRAWQGGGSGIDIEAATLGGLLACRQGEDSTALDMPAELSIGIFYSGRSASTAEKLTALDNSLAAARVRDALAALCASAEALLPAWRDADACAILAGLAEYTAALADFDTATGLGIFEGGHRVLADAAGDGIVYKPCGAGGGDVGAAFALDADRLGRFTATAEAAGFRALPVQLAAAGVTRQESGT